MRVHFTTVRSMGRGNSIDNGAVRKGGACPPIFRAFLISSGGKPLPDCEIIIHEFMTPSRPLKNESNGTAHGGES